MSIESPSDQRDAEVLDLDLVAPFDEKAQREADLLVQTAKVHQEQNDYEGAVRFLKKAAVVIRNRDKERERMVRAFLREVGGQAALDELKIEMRREIGKRITAVQHELIELQRHDSEGAKKFATSEELENRIALLKAENQRLSDEKTALMGAN